MEYQKIANLLDDASNQPSKFKTRNWVEINDESRETYNVNSQRKVKTTMPKSSLWDYGDAYILVKGTITVNSAAAAADADANNTNKNVKFKNCALFANCISEIYDTQVDNAKDIDIIMPLYNLLEYSSAYEKTSGSLWQYCKDIPAVDNNNAIVNFTDNNLTDSFNFKVKMAGQTGDDGTKNVETMVPLAYLSVLWRSLELPFINCEVNLILARSATCVIVSTNVANQNATLSILYPYFKDSYKMIVVDLSKQQALDADPRAIQQISFTANLDAAGNTRIYFILEEVKETILNFAQGTVKVL